MEDSKLIDYIKSEKLILTDEVIEDVKKKFSQSITSKIVDILPPILETGTLVDDTSDIIKKQPKNREKDAININKIIEFDILPSLINLFCFT